MTVTPAVYNPLGQFGSVDRIHGVIELLPTYVDLADRIAYTEFVPGPLRGHPPAVLAALMAGAERGLGPMESLRSINVIDGRPTLSAEVMRALVLAAGHEIEIVDTSDEIAALRGRRRGSENWSPEFVWTLDRARRALLADKANWKKYPEAMLLARASTDLCRAVFPDVVAGLSSTEEWGDVIDTTATDRPPSAGVEATPTPQLDTGDDEPPGGAHDLGLARRLHAEITAAFPTATTASRDRLRHALVAIVTRRRPGGPVQSSAALSLLEQMSLSDRIVDIRRGRSNIVDIGEGIVALRAAGWTYTVELDPLEVTVARSDTTPPAGEPSTPTAPPPEPSTTAEGFTEPPLPLEDEPDG